MKNRRLALRVTLNSALMILGVYSVMQFVGYIRDNVILGISGLGALPATAAAYLGTNVMPPLLVFGAALYLIALPIQRVGKRLEAGESLAPALLERTRLRILGFSRVVLAINLVGFAAGFLILQVTTGHAADILRPDGLILLSSNLAGGAVYAAAQSALNDLAFADIRDRLGVYGIGARRRELRSTTRQVLLSFLLVFYALSFLQYNYRELMAAQAVETRILDGIRSGSVAAEGAGEAYRGLLKERLSSFTSRKSLDLAEVPLPWERRLSREEVARGVFFLYFAFLLAIAAGIQIAVSVELRDRIAALQRRVREVVAGGGDLRARLSIRAMDDFGELGDLINQLLDQFRGVVAGIGLAAERTRAGAAAIDGVLAGAEASTRAASAAALALEADLSAQAEGSRELRAALKAFGRAVEGADQAASAQVRFVSETSASMEEMASSIRSVEGMTKRAGDLVLGLAARGRSGGEDSSATRAAIAEIEAAASKVLAVLAALGKIAGDTNLLAMNAAIEAAHAGERGAGFAVVANEVRTLAANAGVQTKSIKGLVNAMSERVVKGVARAEASGKSLAELVRGLEEAAAISREIAAAMGEQADGTRSAADSLVRIVEASRSIEDRMADQEAQAARMSTSLEAALGRLDALVESSRGQAEGARALRDSFTSVRAEVDRNLEAVDALTAAIGRFGT